jgi:hypothetical protein
LAATVGLDFERKVSAPSIEVRRVLAEIMRELGFKIEVDQLTRLEAKRGSLLGASLLVKGSTPVRAVLEIAVDSGAPGGCLISAHLTDAIRNLGKTWGINGLYRGVFDDIARRLDAALARLDPASATGFAPPRFWSRAAEVPVLDQSNAAVATASGEAIAAAGRALDGTADVTPSAWKGVDSVLLRSSQGVAVLSLAETQADLGIAVMVVAHPVGMEAGLAGQIEAFAAMVERQLTAAAGHAATVEVADDQLTLLELLHRQATIRGQLQMRTLHVCRTCRVEKITNPEYERLATRNEKLRDVVAGVGATVTMGGIAPTFWLGQVFKLKRLDPEYLCAHCQGMEADEWVVTFCPECAELQRAVILTACPKCGFDLETKAPASLSWGAEPITLVETPLPAGPTSIAGPTAPVWPAPADVPLGSPSPGSRPGTKRCQACGCDYPNLWRVIVATPAGYEERFLCGSRPACQTRSVAAPVWV